MSPYGFHETSVPEPEGLVVTIRRSRCLDTAHVRGPTGELTLGPYRPLWDGAFAGHAGRGRLAVAHDVDDGEAWVWLDGRQFGPYDGIGLGPRFSDDGSHVAWASLEGGDQVLYVDGVARRREPRLLELLGVLDDGRVAATVRRDDEKKELIVGETSSGPLDEPCYNTSFVKGPSSRYAYTAKKDGRWITVVDGREVSAPGIPANCAITFSDDGAHVGWVSVPLPEEPRSRVGVVLDGRYFPMPKGTVELRFVGGLPIATGSVEVAQHDWERRVVVVGAATPSVRPTDDAWEPQRGYIGREWVRVQLGDSLGPKLERVERLERGADGRIRYVGARGGVPLEIVDNVILEPPPPARAVAADPAPPFPPPPADDRPPERREAPPPPPERAPRRR